MPTKKIPKSVEKRQALILKPGRFYRRGEMPSIDGVLIHNRSKRAYVETDEASIPEERRNKRNRVYLLVEHFAEPFDMNGEQHKLSNEDVDAIEDLQLTRAWHDAQQTRLEPEQAKFIARALYVMAGGFVAIMGFIVWQTGSLPIL